MSKPFLIAGVLLLLVVGVFGQTLRHEFVNFDDDLYVTDNPHVREGFCADSVAWAFSARDASNWHPVTWLSHMLDCQCYGLSARGHHLTNVLLHAAVAMLLFLVLQQMTGELWPAAFTAAVFAVHPLRVESVAWIAERKDILSGLFFVLTLAAYVAYTRALVPTLRVGTHRPDALRPDVFAEVDYKTSLRRGASGQVCSHAERGNKSFSIFRYWLVMALFALGLMAKPMLVTLPFVLLLLDYWPLGRIADRRRVLLEKTPLFAMSAAACAVTIWAQGETISLSGHVTLPWRLANAVVAYVDYLGQFIYPVNLAVLYPHPGDGLALWKIAAAAVLLVVVTGAVVLLRRRAPYLLVGWFWYVGMLVPVIGLVQVGRQAMADRYTYLPQIGLCIAIAWGAKQFVGSRVWLRPVCGAAAVLVIAVFAACAWHQTAYWRNGETLWTRAIECTRRNPAAHYNLGVVLAGQQRIDEAIAEYGKAVAADPDYAEARFNMAVLLNHQGRTDEAIEQYRRVLEIEPDASDAHLNLGVLLAARGEADEAIRHYREVLRIMPTSADAENNLANVLTRQGRLDEAIRHYKEAVRIDPNHAAARRNLEMALRRLGERP